MIAALLASVTVLTNAVTFTAKATGIADNVPVEFLFAAADSDRDYETLFLLDDPPEALATAFAKAGFPKGGAYAPDACRFWPEGPVVMLSPAVATLLKDSTGAALLPVVFTGGDGGTNQPRSVFSTYSVGQSLLLFDDTLDQSDVYGRFLPARAFGKGEAMTFTVAWDGKRETRALTPDFPSDKTVAEAVKVAEGLAKLDSREAKVNGAREGQFYYRAFLPKVAWRDPKERLVQPLEVRVGATNVTYTVIDEDWSGEGTDPKLTPRTVSEAEARKFAKDTCLFFARPDERLARLYALRRELPKTIRNWYVFVEPGL